MTTNLKSLSTIIGQVEQLNRIGNMLSDLGYLEQKNSRPIQLKPPQVLKNAVNEYIMSLLLAIKNDKVEQYVGTEKEAVLNLHNLNNVLLDCRDFMKPANPKYVGTAIEMCASTFGLSLIHI